MSGRRSGSHPLAPPADTPPTPPGQRRRASALLAGLLLGTLGLGVRLAYVQGVQSEEYSGQARRQRVREIVLPPLRGAIYDRDGRELAMSVPARTVYANPKQIDDPQGTARALSPILGIPHETLAAQLGREDRGFVYLARRIDVAMARKVEQLQLIGVSLLDEARRVYPGGSLGANVIGFTGTDAKGLSGVEFAFERLLGGEPGVRVLEQDPLGRRIPQGVFREVPPVSGSDLILTLNRDIQHAADRALAQAVEDHDANGGSVVVLDPRTGEILAMANRPTFDPNDLSTLAPGVTRNRAVTDAYEPGSVSKVVTAAAALETGTVTPDTPFSVPAKLAYAGSFFSDAHGHATYTLRFEDIIADSSNVGTIKVALQLGSEPLYDYMRRFGYGQATALGFPGESSGLLPRTDRWKTSLPTMAIGQGVSATLLQLMRIYATVANDGVMVSPKLVQGWVDPQGDVHRAPDAQGRRVIRVDVARTLRTILAKVVTDGTGTLAQVAGYPVAGKTGTAQKAEDGGYSGYMGSFVGMVPVDRPQLVVGVVLDEPSPYWGGVVAAPVFKEVAETAVRVLRIPPFLPEPPSGGAEFAGSPQDPELARGAAPDVVLR